MSEKGEFRGDDKTTNLTQAESTTGSGDRDAKVEVYGHDSQGNPQDHLVDDFVADPFSPFNDLPEEKEWVLTLRAVFFGLCAGALVNASNLYLGLKTGWTFPANLFGVRAVSGVEIMPASLTNT